MKVSAGVTAKANKRNNEEDPRLTKHVEQESLEAKFSKEEDPGLTKQVAF